MTYADAFIVCLAIVLDMFYVTRRDRRENDRWDDLLLHGASAREENRRFQRQGNAISMPTMPRRVESQDKREGCGIVEPGIYTISMREYLQARGLSASVCHQLLTYSPFHARYWQTSEERDDSEASDMGTAIHDALLEGMDRIVMIDADDWRTKAAKEQRDAARLAGQIPMLARKVKQIEEAVAAAKAYVAASEIAGVFDSGKPEQTVIWQEGGLPCKARPDWLNDKTILHVKTTQGSAEPNSWIRNQLTPAGYDVACAFYERGFRDAFRQSVFLVIEQNPPYGCSLVALSPAMQDLAARKVDRAIRTWQECKSSGKYPCYPAQIAYAEPRPWEIANEEERGYMFTNRELEQGIPL